MKNISGGPLTDVRYTRNMDWDVYPTPFDEYVTIQGTATDPRGLYADNNGFQSPGPLDSRSGTTGDFVDLGPFDHGAHFDFGFGGLSDGASVNFAIYYGAAGDEAGALAALAAVGANVYSFGQTETDPVGGTPNTFIFALGDTFGKALTSGPDRDGDGIIDVVIPINELVPTAYDFTITYPGNLPVWIYDRVPAEWGVTHIEFDDFGLTLDCGGETGFVGPYGMVEIYRGGKPGKKCNSDTGFRWMPLEVGDNTLNVQTLARCHDNKKNKNCRPTSCGALYLNYGAVAYLKDPETGEPALDEDGNPIVVAGPTEGLCLAAVDDINGDGIGDACDSCPNDPDPDCFCEEPFDCSDPVAVLSECGAGGDCACFFNVDGPNVCVDATTPCDGLVECATGADCAADEACIPQSCCGIQVCVNTSICTDPDAAPVSYSYEGQGPTLGQQ